MSNIALFQNQRNWTQIRDQVWTMLNEDHQQGLAQNSALVQRLETRLATTFHRKHCVTTASCTDALIIAIWCLNLPPQSRIAVSTYTFTATAHAIVRAGHIPVAIDVVDNYCIDVSQIKDCAAVVAVDIFGNMSNWAALDQLGIPVICDAAQSLMSHNGTTWSANQGTISCVSFSPSKPISSWGSGGAILTDDDDIAVMAQLLRLHGKKKNTDASIAPGMNSMISSFEAACISVGLELATQWQRRRHEIAQFLIAQSQHQCVLDTNLRAHDYSKLVFKSPQRDIVISQFQQRDIDVIIHYQRPIHRENLYAADCPQADQLAKESFTVPNQHTLTDREVEQIAETLQ